MTELKNLTNLIVFLPLLGAIVAGFLGRVIGRAATHIITTTLIGIAFFLASVLFYTFLVDPTFSLNTLLYTWGVSGGTEFKLGFLLDNLTAIMLVVVTCISFMVHIYTIGYMHDDPGYQRFFSYISLFTFAMLMLVSANNFLQLFFAWEAVGLMSYLLIGFWYQKEAANFASFKAFIVNRVGDFGFLIGIAAIFSACSSLDYAMVFSLVPNLAESKILLICICLFIGAMAKSAQVPLHVWLPDSMEGPTPISALIHAATMVTAGVFMLARMAPLFECSEVALNFVMLIGSITCLSMGILSIVQNDLKKIIAYSTLSQLGYMVTALGASAYAASIFHLMTHAFYKALLFLGAGSVILAMHHEQNIKHMGGLRLYLPVTYFTMLIASLALIGFPGFSGFFSKDLIIESVHLSTLPAAKFAYFALIAGVFFTALYTFRLIFLVFFGKAKTNRQNKVAASEPGMIILTPLVLLAIPSVIVGWWFSSKLKDFFPNYKLTSLQEHNFMSIANLMLILGISTAWACYIKCPNLPKLAQRKLQFIFVILIEKYGFDLLYQNILAPIVYFIGQFAWKFADTALIDATIVNGSAKTIEKLAKILRRMQTGYIYHYAFFMMTGFFILFSWLVFR